MTVDVLDVHATILVPVMAEQAPGLREAGSRCAKRYTTALIEAQGNESVPPDQTSFEEHFQRPLRRNS